MKEKKQVICACGVLIRDGKVLMQQRNEPALPTAHLKWELPGGKVEFGETPEHAVAREFFEENGRVVRVGSLIPVTVTNVWESKNTSSHVICLFYLCTLIDEVRETPHDPKVAQVEWVDRKSLKSRSCLKGIHAVMASVDNWSGE